MRINSQTGRLESRKELPGVNLMGTQIQRQRYVLLGDIIMIALEGPPRHSERPSKIVELFVRVITYQMRPPLALEVPDRAVDQDHGQSYFSVLTNAGSMPSPTRVDSASSTISGGPQMKAIAGSLIR